MLKDSFKTRLEIAKNKILKKKIYQDNQPTSSLGTAFKMSTELVAHVVVGTIIGFILDKTFGTKPWLILIFFFRRCNCGDFKCLQICEKHAKIK